jgi:hypothetical protein
VGIDAEHWDRKPDEDFPVLFKLAKQTKRIIVTQSHRLASRKGCPPCLLLDYRNTKDTGPYYPLLQVLSHLRFHHHDSWQMVGDVPPPLPIRPGYKPSASTTSPSPSTISSSTTAGMDAAGSSPSSSTTDNSEESIRAVLQPKQSSSSIPTTASTRPLPYPSIPFPPFRSRCISCNGVLAPVSDERRLAGGLNGIPDLLRTQGFDKHDNIVSFHACMSYNHPIHIHTHTYESQTLFSE